MIPSYYDAPDRFKGSVPMRGDDRQSGWMFSYVSPEERVPATHPLRAIRRMTDAIFDRLSPRLDRLYSDIGRPSIPPEKLLRALLLQGLYTVRSERLLMEQLQYNLLFRWFVGLSMDDPVWDATTFTKNRDRLLEGEIADAFFREVLAEAEAAGLVSDEHFTVDGTLLEAWASQKSFRRRDTPADPPDDPGNPTINFRGEQRKNDTRQSTETEIGRAGVWVDEDRRPVAQAPSSRWSARRLDLYLSCGGLQPGPAAAIARPAGLT